MRQLVHNMQRKYAGNKVTCRPQNNEEANT